MLRKTSPLSLPATISSPAGETPDRRGCYFDSDVKVKGPPHGIEVRLADGGFVWEQTDHIRRFEFDDGGTVGTLNCEGHAPAGQPRRGFMLTAQRIELIELSLKSSERGMSAAR